MLPLVFVLNFVISWVNAWGCGKTWNETKAGSPAAHFMNWMGAIMSASGFTWCYLVIAGYVGSQIPVEQANHVKAPLLTPTMLQAFAELGYLVVLLPILGSGIAIMLHSWGVFWRERNLYNGATAGWNTFANIHNMYSAARNVPGAVRGVGSFFSSDDDDDRSKAIVVMLVVGAAFAGVLTTRAIIRATARRTAAARAFDLERYREGLA